MSDLAIFVIGTIVFFVGGVGVVLYGLDTFQLWSRRETAGDQDRHLDHGTVAEVIGARSEPPAA